MTVCTTEKLLFPDINRRKVEVNFEGGEVTSDGGALLLREVDAKLNLLARVAPLLPDDRAPSRIVHSNLELLSQRVFALALGYEDLNDHDDLKNDVLFQNIFGKEETAASSPTLCRFENRMDRTCCIAIHELLFDVFVKSFDKPPDELVLDFDATDDLVYGKQKGKAFNGYYGHDCFLPLHVFCQGNLLVSYLRPGTVDGAKHALAIFHLLATALKKQWPDVKIIFRGDSGFGRKEIMSYCERKGFFYVTGFAGNSVLYKKATPLMEEAKNGFKKTEEKQKLYGHFFYGAKSWGKERNVIVKAEHNSLGSNTRFVVTNLSYGPEELYTQHYCLRGQMENDIKLIKNQLFSDRTSCSDWNPNQFRLMLSSLAYILMHHIKTVVLKKTELEGKEFNTIRLKLLKIGAVIIKNTRRLKVMLSSAYPYKNIFKVAHATLVPG